ncbi:MAG: tRNA pseudouridine(38-40) synthase TruA [Methylophilaceae bacterium]|nr:tRNA pseudouridine(38-40) synthase TruA [Methylophilaceae bacterium]
MKIALGLAYDGAAYCGWQSQPNGLGVQNFVEYELARVADHPVRLHAAGRTDSGVHASYQVAHFETSATRPLSAWVRGVNSHLPWTIRVLWARLVSDDFHARFSARARRYQYLLQMSPVAPALLQGRVGWYHRSLDVVAMQQASTLFLGEHDFSAFRSAECQAKTTRRTMLISQVEKRDKWLIFEFVANAFLHHQVRNMVGTLVYVGRGSLSLADVQALLLNRDRRLAPPTFVAAGLYLSDVVYDERFGLPLSEPLRFIA